MRIDVDAVQRAVDQLKAIHGGLGAGFGPAGGLTAFTAASGFREAGRGMGRVSGHHAPEAVGVYASHVLDTAVTAEVNLKNALLADGTWARALTMIQQPTAARTGGGLENYLPNTQAVNARATDFAPHSPVVGYAPALLPLNNRLAASNFAAPAVESAYWESVAAQITAAVHELFGPRQALATSAETDWVRRGDQQISRMQRAGAAFAANAHRMAAHSGALDSAIGSEAVMAAAASATYLAIVHPAARKSFEQAYLAAYPPRAAAGLAATVPAFTKLLPDLDRIPGDPFSIDELSTPAAPSFEATPLPTVVREALAANGHVDLAHASTPAEVIGQYGQPNPDVLQAIAAGATPTQASAVAAPHMPPTLHPGTAPAGGAALPLSSAAARLAPVLGNVGATTLLGGPAGRTSPAASKAAALPATLVGQGGGEAPAAAGAPTGVGRHRAVGQVAEPPRAPGASGHAGAGSAASHAGAHAGSAGGGSGAGAGGARHTAAYGTAGRTTALDATRPVQATSFAPGSFGGMGIPAAKSRQGGAAPVPAGGLGGGAVAGLPGGFGGFAGQGGAGSVGLGGAAGAGLAGAGGSAGFAGSSSAGSSTSPHTTAGGAGQSRAMAMGGAPIGASGASRGGERKGGRKVKAVTSAVEREGNLKALLGDAPLVLPPVIGDEVRSRG